MTHYITNIQRMCMQDGPGIRTTVFMKGCTLHCPWCSNPENIEFNKETYYDYDTGEKTIGEFWTQERLFFELIKDEDYWVTGGGVTFSGGESLMHMDYLKDVMQLLKERKVHIAVETALFVPQFMIELALKYVDFFYIDLKILLPNQCASILGGDVKTYLNNFYCIKESGKEIKIRIPCVDEYTISTQNRQSILDFLKKNIDVPVEIFMVHDLAREKYKRLRNVELKKYSCNKKEFYAFYDLLLQQGNRVNIVRL